MHSCAAGFRIQAVLARELQLELRRCTTTLTATIIRMGTAMDWVDIPTFRCPQKE